MALRVSDLLPKHSELFTESYEGMKQLEAHITMKSDAKPIFAKARRVPYALKEQIEKELDKPEKHGVIKNTDKSHWASPIVVVPKADDTVRICVCGDYKSTFTQSVEHEQYALPTTKDLYTALVGSKIFSKLDLSHAYANGREKRVQRSGGGGGGDITIPYGLTLSKIIGSSSKNSIVTSLGWRGVLLSS